MLDRTFTNTYLDKVLKRFKMDQSKKGFLHVLQGVKLSQTQCPTTAEDREKCCVPDLMCASAIGSIMYAMLCTRPNVCLIRLRRIYNFLLYHANILQLSYTFGNFLYYFWD